MKESGNRVHYRRSISIYEFDVVCAERVGSMDNGTHALPNDVYEWLEKQCLKMSDSERPSWLRMTQRQGHRVVQFKSYAGVVRAPCGFQIEVLPKVGRAIEGGVDEARVLLIKMLRCLPGFRHIRTANAQLLAKRMELPEVFIAEFLRAVQWTVKRGLRHDYTQTQNNLRAIRGKLLTVPHFRKNMFRKELFFTEHDEFSANRPENRLIHAALRQVLFQTTVHDSQRSARELLAAFDGVPASVSPDSDMRIVRPDRSMSHYDESLSWARLILADRAPVTGTGRHRAPSLLFPMEAVFEAFVTKHVQRQVSSKMSVKRQLSSHRLVSHKEERWFRLKPDLILREGRDDRMVLDAKWKLLDSSKANRSNKYGLSQNDFYQLQAYGLSYLKGKGDVALVYPKTNEFNEPLEKFLFEAQNGLRLWVLPFCLKIEELSIPQDEEISGLFSA